MPFKFHASRRHHIPRAKYRVMNWPDYDRGLVRRGDIRFWIDESALEQWDAAKRRTPGGQRRFSELAISTTLMLGVVFRLPLRQTEGFVSSLVDLMGCDLPVPDHTTLSRRRRTVDVVVETSTNKRSTDIVLDSTGLKFFGAGEWARAKHGETRRSWRKLHISVDPASSEIRTHELTGDDTADATMAGPLVAGSGGMIRRVFADGAHDGEPVTKAIREARPPNSPPEIIIPPRATSIPPPDTPHGGSEREHSDPFGPSRNAFAVARFTIGCPLSVNFTSSRMQTKSRIVVCVPSDAAGPSGTDHVFILARSGVSPSR